MMPHCRDLREETFRPLIVLNIVNSSVARSKETAVATVVMEELQRLRSGD
jgi:hypothetical protein